MCFLKIPRIPPFLIKKLLKNRYTRKQPTHFSMTLLGSKLKRKKLKLIDRKIR